MTSRSGRGTKRLRDDACFSQREQEGRKRTNALLLSSREHLGSSGVEGGAAAAEPAAPTRRVSTQATRVLADAIRGGAWAVAEPGNVDEQRWGAPDALRGLGAALGARGDDLAALIRGELAPRWLRCVRAAAIARADPLDLADFYARWRDRLLGGDDARDGGKSPPKLPAAAAAAALEMLACGLDLIGCGLDDAAALARAPPPALCGSDRSFERERRIAAPAPAAPPPAPPAARWDPGLDSSGFAVFADVVARFAAENDVVYAPKLGRAHDGKQLYRFGPATIYLDRNVTFVKKAERFAPVALEDLLEIARSLGGP